MPFAFKQNSPGLDMIGVLSHEINVPQVTPCKITERNTINPWDSFNAMLSFTMRAYGSPECAYFQADSFAIFPQP